MNPYTKPEIGISVHVTSWLSTCPHTGMVPLSIAITNDTTDKGAWDFRFNHQSGQVGTTSSFTAGLGAGESGEWRFLAPVGTSSSNYGYLNLFASGTGLSSPGPQLSSKYSGSSSAATPYVGVSEDLAGEIWEKLNKLANGTSGPASGSVDLLRGSRLDMANAPADWRGYTALNQLWTSEREWTRLSAEQKRAISEWVSTGGHLCVVSENAALSRQQELQLPGRVQDRHLCFGAGEIMLYQKTSSADQGAALVMQRLSVGRTRDLPDLIEKFKDWGLLKALGQFKMMSGLVLGFIVLFGILVGPVNLMWCSRESRRHLLFITTPLLSIAGTIFLVAFMLIQDGTGGDGSRFIAAFVEPSENLTTVLQEQCSRTGVLLDRSFTTEEPVWCQMGIASKPSASYSSYRGDLQDGTAGSYTVNGREHSGDFFRSRSVQAHYVATVRRSRGGVALQRDAGAPGKPAGASVLSSLALPLKTVFIVEPGGQIWKASNIEAGRRAPLEPGTLNEVNSELQTHVKTHAGPVLRKMLESKTGDRGIFIALCDDGGKLAVKTLDSIRWEKQPAVVTGPYTE